VLAGNGLSSSNGTCWVLDEKGRLLRSYFNGSWCTSLPAIAVSAGSGPASGGGDLHHDGRNTIFCGNNRGDVRAYPAEEKKPVERWIRNLTRPVRSLTILPGRKENLLAVGSDSGYLCAFNEEGKKAWGLPLSSAIFKTGLVQHAVSPPLPFGSGPQVRRLAAACKDGKVFLVSTDGRLISYFDCKARSQDMITADLDGDGTDEIIVATSGPNRLWAALTK
jgi:outer membrane protein assembly factor BamB